MPWLIRLFGRLRYPWAVAIMAVIFIVDVIVPDLIPFADEVILGLVTALLATRRKKQAIDTEARPVEPAKLDGDGSLSD